MPMTQEDIFAHYQKTWAARGAADDPATALTYSNEIEDGVIYPVYEDLLRRSRVPVDGGRVLDVSELTEWAREMPSKQSPVMDSFQTPLWHLPWMFVAALLLLVTEWWLRRRHWLP